MTLPRHDAMLCDCVFGAIRAERGRQYEKWGRQRRPDFEWLAILIEELGEASEAMLEGDGEGAERELTEAAAVAVAWLESRFESRLIAEGAGTTGGESDARDTG